MPLLGLIPFLHTTFYRSDDGIIVCQCPYSGLSHFYDGEGDKGIIIGNVSMPLLGLIPFLPTTSAQGNVWLNNVSMPLLGLIPFLRLKTMI